MNWFRGWRRWFWIWMGYKPVFIRNVSVRHIGGKKHFLFFTLLATNWASQEDRHVARAKVLRVVNRKMKARGVYFTLAGPIQEM